MTETTRAPRSPAGRDPRGRVFRALLGLPPRLVAAAGRPPGGPRRPAARPGDAVAAAAPAARPATRALRPAARSPRSGGVRRAAARRLAGGRQPIGETRRPGGARRDGPVPAAALHADASPGRLGPSAASPLLVFLHGGGMVFGDLDTPRRDLPAARRAGRRHASSRSTTGWLPSTRSPAAVDDCWAGVPVGGRARRGARGRPGPDRGRRRLGRRHARARSRRSRPPRPGVPLRASSCWSTRRRTWPRTARAGGCSARASS